MKFIEQLLDKDKTVSLWFYLPFPFFFLGMMFLNVLVSRYGENSTSELIRNNIELYGKNLNFLMTVGPILFMLLLLVAWALSVQKQSLRSLMTGRSKIDWKRVGTAFGIWSAVMLGMFAYEYYTHPDLYVIQFDFVSFFVFLLLALLLIPLQVLFEEYFFRGYLMQGIGLATRSRGAALIVTSLLFGLMHMANPEIEKLGYLFLIYYIGAGFFMGILTLMDDGVELAFGFHTANNLVGALLVTSDWTAFQTNSLFLEIATEENNNLAWELLIQIGLVFPILILVFSRLYGWKDWKYRLFGPVLKS